MRNSYLFLRGSAHGKFITVEETNGRRKFVDVAGEFEFKGYVCNKHFVKEEFKVELYRLERINNNFQIRGHNQDNKYFVYVLNSLPQDLDILGMLIEGYRG